MESKVWESKLTPLQFLARSANVFRERTAVIHGDKRYTYPEFQARVHRLASALRRYGLAKGDRVAFLVPNIPQMLESHFAVPLAGGVLVAINTRLSSDEIAFILNHSGSKMLFVDTELANLVKPVLDRLETVKQIVNIEDVPNCPRLDGLDYEDFLSTGSPVTLDWPVADEEETIAINYTSGTTGSPKGVMYSHRGAYLNALGQVLETKLDSNSVYLWTLPMFHCNGWCFTWGVIAAGGANLCLRKVDPPLIWQLVKEEKVSHFNGAPTVLISLANDPAARTVKLSHKVKVATGGAPPSPTIIKEMSDLGIEVTHLYGLTETYGPYTICEWQSQWNDLPLGEQAKLKARQGVNYITADRVRVVDPEMRDVPADAATMGEVVMRGNSVMKGYYDNPEATEEAFRGGWFHSGDIGVMHPDGYIELRDRKKDIIISGGENISTIEVERAIAQHPAVMEVAVIAIPNEKWGEVPKAFVILKPDASATEREILDFTRQQLAHFKCPKSVEFGDLPKTSTGKIQKFVLREKEWAGYDKRVH